MTQTEINAVLDTQLGLLHKAANQVTEARRTIRESEGVILDCYARSQPGGLFSLAIAAMIVMLLLIEIPVLAPALRSRFAAFGMPDGLAWFASVSTSVLLMFAETVAAVGWFNAHERALITRRYVAVAGWTLMVLCIVGVPMSLQISQLLLVADIGAGGTLAQAFDSDPARIIKEVGLLFLFAGAPILLIFCGRYLETAKAEAVRSACHLMAVIRRASARNTEVKAHNEVANEYRIHQRTVQRGQQDGLFAELGPFEDQALALIRERHANVDDLLSKQLMIRRY